MMKMNSRDLLSQSKRNNGIKIVRRGRGYIEAIRPDGLRIFLDGDPTLDMVRVNAIDRKLVILAVAYRRAQQIACNYARRYAPDLLPQIEKAVGYDNRCERSLDMGRNKSWP